MPHRAFLRSGKKIIEHLHSHPWRVAATLAVLLVLSFSFLAWSFVYRLDVARQGRIDNCNAVNELSRKIYVTLADFDVPQYQRDKFKPTMRCEHTP